MYTWDRAHARAPAVTLRWLPYAVNTPINAIYRHYQIKKIKDTGSTSRKQGSGRPRTAVNDDNKAYEEEMIVSQEDQPGAHN